MKTNDGIYTRPVTNLYPLEKYGGYDRRLDEIETNDEERDRMTFLRTIHKVGVIRGSRAQEEEHYREVFLFLW